MTVFTIGHSTRSLADFMALLQKAGADRVVDVRRFPHSPRQPHFNIETLPGELAKAGIGYVHMPALGGRRGSAGTGASSVNTLWREKSFRHYADYAQTPAFRAAFAELPGYATSGNPALMCAEALWWRCHRRIIADYLLAAGVDVAHIMDNKIEPARLTAGAVARPDGSIAYSDMPLLDRMG